MDREKWDWKDWERGELTINGGAGNKGQGIFISAREMSRFGQLFLNKGKWCDKQLISETWVDSASGYNNNNMFIIPEWNMVIVRLGLDQSDFHITDEIYNTFLQKVGKIF